MMSREFPSEICTTEKQRGKTSLRYKDKIGNRNVER